MSLYKNITASGSIHSGAGTVYGVIVNSHSSGTLRLNDSTASATANPLAVGTLTSDATNVSDGDWIRIGSLVYRLMDTPARAYDVQIGADAATTLDNIKAAINASGTPGVEYYTGTSAHPDVTAETNTDTTQVIQAKVAGGVGMQIVTLESSSHLSWGAATLVGANIINTFTFPTGSGVYTFPVPIDYFSGLYATVGGTLDCTLLYTSRS